MPAGKKNAGLLTIQLLWTATLFCQYKFDKPVLITKENGLPVNFVTAVSKSDDGFMWMGGSEGLCRFDGREVKIFTAGANLRYSLFDNRVNGVLADKKNVWVATSQGVSVLNTMDNSFRHYQFNERGKTDSVTLRFDQFARVLFKDRAGKIWIGTAHYGVCMYDEETDNFRFFNYPENEFLPLSPSLGSDIATLSITASIYNDSIIWAGTPSGLKEINKFSGKTTLFTFLQKDKEYQIALNAFRRIYHHDNGLLYVGSWAAGVNVFDPVTKSFTPLPVKNTDGKKILQGTIGGLYRKNENEFWISSSAGLAVYDTRLGDVTMCWFNNMVENEFYAVDFIDEAGRVWHSNINGLQYFDPVMQQFGRHSFKKLSGPDWAYAFYILPDPSGKIITVCPRVTNGIYHFNRQEKLWTKIEFPRNKTFKDEKDVIRGFIQLPSGEYIITSYRGIYRFSETSKQFTEITHQLPASVTRLGDILLDRSGYLWLTADEPGLIKWNLTTGQYKIYGKEYLLEGEEKYFGRLVHLFEDSRGNIWFERSGGFSVYVKAEDSIRNFIFTINEKNSFPVAHSFTEDKNGRIWVSSSDGWLGYALSGEPGKGIVYKTNIREKGLTGSFSYLATDKLGDVWGYNSKTLVKINSDDLSLSRFSFQYGIGEPDFYHFSFLPSGEMVFGGRNDITIAHPDELKRNTEIPSPYISEIQVLNQPFNFIMDGRSLRLRYRQNFFSIGFSAIAYTMSKDVKFRYRLKGFDDWSEPTSRHFANYTNVPGGDYVFQLQAANNEGVWNEKILELPVWVNTPFWLRWWFRIAVVLAVVFIIISIYRYRASQFRKKQKLKSEYEKKLANVELSALLAQMNPHFLFNSLNSIDSYIIRNESKKASEYLNNFARLMRLILQNSRSNYISLKDELEALDLYLQMESLRFKDKFSYSISVDENVDTNAIVIPPMLIQPYVENAIWHGLMLKANGEAGKVELRVSKKEDELVCVIHDNGIGRKKAAELKAHKQNSHKRSMGMQITEDRIEIINKLYNMNASVRIYDLENEAGEALGTKVELTIPV
jgi:ligand-binding sensor domain-containing protein/two-component sensor histidine kinase